MDLDAVLRPSEPVPEYRDTTPRRKCSVCCALRCAALAGAGVFVFSFPCQLLAQGGRLCEGNGWRGFCNRHLHVPLPVAAVVLTHHYLMSEALWSRHNKTLWQVTTSTMLMNLVLWCVTVGACTLLSRRYLPRYSHAYRVRLWNYRRATRACANAYLPSLLGRLTYDMDCYTLLWIVCTYHALWYAVMLSLEHDSRAHYAMPFMDTWYSAWCSPRWREWRELQVRRHVYTTMRPMQRRWSRIVDDTSVLPRR